MAAYGPIETVKVYGWLLDNAGKPVVGKRVEAFATKEEIFHITKKASIHRSVIATTTNSDGYWELDIISTDDIIPVETKYIFRFGERDSYIAAVPKEQSEYNFADLDYDVGWE